MQSNNSAQTALNDLMNVIVKLRDPRKGSKWDLSQTHLSLIPYVLEEAHEVADAIRNGNAKEFKEELGDLLLQVLLHAQIASEEKRFNLSDVIKSLHQKLLRRNPHIFEKKKSINGDWQSSKEKERTLTYSSTPISDKLSEKVRSQPALTAAMVISKKAADAGLEWESIEGVWEKVQEEIKELKEAIDRKDREHAEAELGDVLFALINIARWCELNPEEGLTGTNQRFLERFSLLEIAFKSKISDHSLSELKQQWEVAKSTLEQSNSLKKSTETQKNHDS